jgi:glycosyltransferase involved in cell wall biosynthesis
MHVAAFEPWYGGSHARFLDGWARRSTYDVRVHGLPARHWQWRMASGAWALARRAHQPGAARPDVLVASDYVDLARLVGLLPHAWRDVPSLLYFHENQLTFPLPPGVDEAERDLTHGFTNLLSCLAASCVVFNSEYHRRELRAAAEGFLERLPAPKPRGRVLRALDQALVIGPGIDLAELPLGAGAPPAAPLRIAWNHRWEHDKDPAAFLRAVQAARGQGTRLELVLLGSRFDAAPPGVEALLDDLRACVHVLRRDAPRAEYVELLAASDVAVSTARHEFYGIAALEALGVGCALLAPRRLSYPDVVPPELQADVLYDSDGQLAARLAALARDPRPARDPERRRARRAAVEAHDAAHTAARLDALCAGLERR